MKKRSLKKIARRFTFRKFFGFTLVETMVVIGIVGLLTGIVSTSVNISSTVTNAHDATRKSNLNLLHKAFVQYYVENRCIPPYQLWNDATCGDGVPEPLKPFLSTFPCDPETGAKYGYELLEGNCKQCNGGCGVCVGFRLLTQLKQPTGDPPAGAGCNKESGCGKNAANGKPYNYGVAMQPPSCVIPTPTRNPTPTTTPTPTNGPTGSTGVKNPTPTTAPASTSTPTPLLTSTPTPLIPFGCYGLCKPDFCAKYYGVGTKCFGADDRCYVCDNTGAFVSASGCIVTPTPTPPQGVQCYGQCKTDASGRNYPYGTSCYGMDNICYTCQATGSFCPSSYMCSNQPTPNPLQGITCTGQCLEDATSRTYAVGHACYGRDYQCYVCATTGYFTKSPTACAGLTPPPPTPTPAGCVGQCKGDLPGTTYPFGHQCFGNDNGCYVCGVDGRFRISLYGCR